MSESAGPTGQRILYVISAYSGSTTGSGGHYYSARDVAAVLQDRWPGVELRMLVLGDLLPGAIRNGSVPYRHVSPAGKGLREYCREVVASVDDFAPTIVHAYDNKSYFFARSIARRHRAKRFLTKPAGPGPGVTFPHCPDVVCFSEENLAALRSRRWPRPSRLHLIPNRVAFPVSDTARVAALRAAIGEGDVLLRIARIGAYHRGSIEQTLALARLMRLEGIAVRAVIVGAAESRSSLKALQAQAEADDVFVTDPSFVVEAAALLDVATYVAGTGRGVVEAAMRRKWVFVPTADAGLPALVTPSNWRSLSYANFSARTRALHAGGPADLPLLRELTSDSTRAKAFLNDVSVALAGAYGPDGIPRKYRELYACEQVVGDIELLDTVVNSGAFLAAYLRRRSLRRSRA